MNVAPVSSPLPFPLQQALLTPNGTTEPSEEDLISEMEAEILASETKTSESEVETETNESERILSDSKKITFVSNVTFCQIIEKLLNQKSHNGQRLWWKTQRDISKTLGVSPPALSKAFKASAGMPWIGAHAPQFEHVFASKNPLIHDFLIMANEAGFTKEDFVSKVDEKIIKSMQRYLEIHKKVPEQQTNK